MYNNKNLYSLLIFIIIPFNYIFVKFVLNTKSINLIILYTFFFIFNHLFYSIIPEKYKINSFILSSFTTLSYLSLSFISILISLNRYLILQHIIVCFPSFVLYNIIN